MPYCPKCDMEFVEGITVCSDCGSPLYESVEAAEAARKAKEEKALAQFVRSMAPGWSEDGEAEAADGDDGMDEGTRKELQKIAQQIVLEQAKEETAERTHVSVYVKKSEHYNDLKSSAAAFLLMGCVSALLAAAFLGGLIPGNGNTRWVFGGVLAAAGLGFFYIWSKTKKDMVSVKEEAAKEEARTRELVEQFLAAHPAAHIDRQLAQEAALTGDSEDTAEELSLKRYGLIQDLLVTENDLPDPAYVDALAEEIYDRLFGKG